MNDATALAYKVVELSTVDERSLEDAVNHWVERGWRLENVQFAMRESSRRPSMAFVFFTRSASSKEAPSVSDTPDTEGREARARLERIADRGATALHATDAPAAAAPPQDAWARLRQLAEEDDGGGETPEDV